MKFKKSKRNWRFIKAIFCYEAVTLLNGLDNLQNSKASKYLKFLELEGTKGTVNKSLYQKLTIKELFLNRMNIFSFESSKKPFPDMHSAFYRIHKTVFNLFLSHLFPSASPA